MRPDASPDPAVESLEELADVGAFVILTPAPQERIKPRDQFLGSQRCRPFSPLPYLVLETTNGLLLGIRIERILSGLTTYLALGQRNSTHRSCRRRTAPWSFSWRNMSLIPYSS